MTPGVHVNHNLKTIRIALSTMAYHGSRKSSRAGPSKSFFDRSLHTKSHPAASHVMVSPMIGDDLSGPTYVT